MSCKWKCQLMQKLEKQQNDDYKSLRIHMEGYPIGFIKFLKRTAKKYDAKTLINHPYYKNKYSYLYSYNVFHPPVI